MPTRTFAANQTDYIDRLNELANASFTYSAQGSNFTAVPGYLYGLTANTLSITLPSAATTGDRIRFIAAAAGVLSLTLLRNGLTIENLAADYPITATSIDQLSIELVYQSGYGWRIIHYGASTPGAGNSLINGDFDIAQKATSYVLTSTLTYGCVDRWYMGQPTPAATASQLPTTAFPFRGNALKVLLTGTGTGSLFVGQVMESLDVTQLQGQTAVLSFWCLKGTTWNPTNLRVRVITGTGTDQGSASLAAATWTGQANTLDTTVTPTTGAVLYYALVSIPSNATELAVQFNATPTGAAVDANSFIEITGVSLRVGNAPPVSRDARPYAQEFALCQRFYRRFASNAGNHCWLSGMEAASSTLAQGPCPLLTGMRVSPTITFSAVADLFLYYLGSNNVVSSVSISPFKESPLLLASFGSGLTAGNFGILFLQSGTGKFFDAAAEL